MNPTARFSTKAVNYARYRWGYSPQAINTIFDTVPLTRESVVADLGSGTGLLTRHFLGKVKTVFAVEPNAEMRAYAEVAFSGQPGFTSIAAPAESTGLPDRCADLISVGQAIHWFDPEQAYQEMQRIRKPGGWLAILTNVLADTEIEAALSKICTEENGWKLMLPAFEKKPVSYWYGIKQINGEPEVEKKIFPVSNAETWEEFFGGLCSNSYSPDGDNPLFEQFKEKVHQIFQSHNIDGKINTIYHTELYLHIME